MARPLQKTYSPTHPYVVERHDQEDGSITYERLLMQITYLERAVDKLETFNRERRGTVHLRQEEAIELWRFVSSFLDQPR